MKKTKDQEFVELFRYWTGRLELQAEIPVVKDNRYDCHACVENCPKTRKPILKYNAKKLSRLSRAYLVFTVFHEIGHIRDKVPYNTETQKVYAEYRAEKFALRMLKKHYPRLYRENLSLTRVLMADRKWIKENNLHYKAFKKIREYNPAK